MNTNITSKEAILQNCRELVSENGLPALNMRAVAQRCNVALGSLYNYFPSKSDLIIATIESVWQDIFHMERPCEGGLSFLDYVGKIFERLKAGMIAYPNFFTTHSIVFASEDKGSARQTMEQYFVHIRNGLMETLKQDVNVRQDVFDETFTQSALVDFVLSGILSLLMQQRDSCRILLEMIRRTLY